MLGKIGLFRSRLLKWYGAHRRDLPWRVPPDAPAGALPDPYHVLVSEAMLQQTQVATVRPYFLRFIECLPDFTALATADEQDVLRLWQGLGYYSRARNLQKAAQVVVERFAGRLPDRPEELLELPGVGRYTAGALASLAHNRRAPILDGNVIRVLSRLDAMRDDPRAGPQRQRLWQRAEQLLPSDRCGDFNSALMELGATICTPRNPRCLLCPVRGHCSALAQGIAEQIPPPRKSIQRPVERRWTFCIDDKDRWLIEQRPKTGRWAGMWQFLTIEAKTGAPRAADIRSAAGIALRGIQKVGEISHALTHRLYEIEVFRGRMSAQSNALPTGTRRWVGKQELDAYPMSAPQVQIQAMVGAR